VIYDHPAFQYTEGYTPNDKGLLLKNKVPKYHEFV
ncbi:NADH dehydrogenase [ubiquinone] 1 alpha subcomplex subunit 10, partial [Danaus plexippus plexippus]